MPTEPTEKPVSDQLLVSPRSKSFRVTSRKSASAGPASTISRTSISSSRTTPSRWSRGVSGSGKSSLAFDTLYAEGQRRYIESLSAYARQFLERIEKPDVDEITGIAPAIAIRQKNSTRNPRSTVATATEIYDYLRLLFARIGRTFCLRCGEEVRKDTLDEIAAKVLALPEGRRFYVLYELRLSPDPAPADATNAPNAPRARKPNRLTQDAVRESLISLRKRGFNRLYQSGRVFEFSTPEDLLDVDFAKPVYVLVDRLALSPEVRSRLMDSIEICYREGRGEAILEFVPDSAGATPARAHGLQRALRMQKMRLHLPGTRAAPFFFQQSLRCLPPLPGFRQHHRFRSRPRDPRQKQIPRGRRDRAVDQAALSPAGHRDAQIRARQRHPVDVAYRDLTSPSATPSSKATKKKATKASKVSSTGSSAKNTNCTFAFFSAATAVTPPAPIATALACAPKPAP